MQCAGAQRRSRCRLGWVGDELPSAQWGQHRQLIHSTLTRMPHSTHRRRQVAGPVQRQLDRYDAADKLRMKSTTYCNPGVSSLRLPLRVRRPGDTITHRGDAHSGSIGGNSNWLSVWLHSARRRANHVSTWLDCRAVQQQQPADSRQIHRQSERQATDSGSKGDAAGTLQAIAVFRGFECWPLATFSSLREAAEIQARQLSGLLCSCI